MQMLYRLSYEGRATFFYLLGHFLLPGCLERETGFEPATLSLEG